MGLGTEAQKYAWEGAIPLQIHLHESEITTLPSPPPALILGPRIGYLPLLVPLVKPYFSSTLPPGVDTVWFDYKGLPLKWYIPTGVLFDLLCVEPERPWNLTVHFRGYPGDLLSPCEGEESVKWSFINSLKEKPFGDDAQELIVWHSEKHKRKLAHEGYVDGEAMPRASSASIYDAAYIMNGNCKNVMNMSQSDQLELWRSVVNGSMEGYLRISSKLKLGTVGEEGATKVTSCSTQAEQTISETDIAGPSRTGRIPVRLYVRNVDEDLDDFGDVPPIDSWDRISYINQPVEIHREEGKFFTLHDAVRTLLPEFFAEEPSIDEQILRMELEDEPRNLETNLCNQSFDNASTARHGEVGETLDKRHSESSFPSFKAEIKLLRVQGIEPKLDIPFSWIVKNLMNPEHFLHICVCVGVSHDQAKTG